MKSFRSLFFTMPAKGIFCCLLLALSVFLAHCNIQYFNLYAEDKASFVNAITQIDYFNYESSYYFRSTVETTLENVTELAFEYEEIFEKGSSAEELLKHFGSIGNSSFSDIYKNLSSMKGFRFAVVNHTRQKIYSNIPQINGKASDTDIKSYFVGEGKNQLIVRSCHNPYFATDSFITFAEHIRALAKKYGDNFDIYITFGSEESYAEAMAECEQLHKSMRSRIEKLNDTAAVCISALILVSAVLITVTGKQEPGGKTYPTVINRLPNDLIVILYGILLLCEISLYRTTSSMLISHGNELDEFWFTHSNEFYIIRICFCIVVFICAAVNLICILKRSYKTGQLTKNTYLYSFYKTLKSTKSRGTKPENEE